MSSAGHLSPADDVLVVGAGPTGLFLAGDLATAGLRVTVLEKRPGTQSNLTRAFAVHARTLELLDARGLSDDLLRTGTRVGAVRVFAGAEVPLADLPGRFPFVLVTPQYEVERLLRRRALDAGVRFRHDHRVTSMLQDADGVTLDVATPDGADRRRAPWAVGTDGVRSTVRQALGVPFPGRTVIRAMILADVRLSRRPPDVLTVASRDGDLGFLAPFGDGWYRFIGWRGERDLDEPVTLDEVREVARGTLGDDLGMCELRYGGRFAADERQAPTYRVGRVLLAGDAAHAHSPAGGMGMNTGLQDAANLSWRLVGALRGGDDAVLDEYSTERHRVGAGVVRASGGILRLAVARGRRGRLARSAAGTVLAHGAPARRRAALMVSGIGIRYPAPSGGHRWVGRRVPDLPLVVGPAGARLAEALRAGRFVLVLPRPDAVGDPAADPPAAVAGETDVGHRIVVHRADDRRSALLVRPDGYLAWTDAPSPR
ncbi:FAD-dependent oxidoreductase [Isoptericola dokdonensis]|uniref:Pentachlorophenol 4-monooxygenase n=1 Tax=Isoptericola dokdonensis DS-3 TaxID=1300344 RepID=A0A168EKM3_9MICO|nr:FAD-dependent oxidoreductase [Isoptericola dokdonensis]ANC30142.1 Pentachlorophenol 4-monooxygenase [Isoptericola dokdonensis DS-3]